LGQSGQLDTFDISYDNAGDGDDDNDMKKKKN
jgi:hypothetical protein